MRNYGLVIDADTGSEFESCQIPIGHNVTILR